MAVFSLPVYSSIGVEANLGFEHHVGCSDDELRLLKTVCVNVSVGVSPLGVGQIVGFRG